MGFVNRRNDGEDEQLPAAAGLEVDVDPRRCPSCRRETGPWQARCPDCGEVPVRASQLPSAQVDLPPGLAALAAEVAAEDEATGAGGGPDTDRPADAADGADEPRRDG